MTVGFKPYPFSRSSAFELMRKAVLRLAAKHERVRSLINPRQTSAITYTESQLNAAENRLDTFPAGPVSGAVLSECPLTIVEGGISREGRLFAAYGAKAGTVYVVRPDGHVLGRWHAGSAADVVVAIRHALHPQSRPTNSKEITMTDSELDTV